MKQRKITANYIYTGNGTPLKNGILVLENNVIVDIINRQDDVQEIANLEFYGGMLVPSFVDAFILLCYPNFSKLDIEQWQNTGKLRLPAPSTHAIQKGINHLEAFGTKGAMDIEPISEGEILKAKSKVAFTQQQIHFDLPFQNNTNNCPILINRHTIDSKKELSSIQFHRYIIGTGSLTTHKTLSVFEELKYIQSCYPYISCFELLKWATLQPANFLGLSELGVFEIGKSPGVNLITAIDYSDRMLSPQSELKLII